MLNATKLERLAERKDLRDPRREKLKSRESVGDIDEKEAYLNCSFKVHVGSLIRSLGEWIKMHLKINAICIFRGRWNQLQLPCHFIVFTNVFLSLKEKVYIES